MAEVQTAKHRLRYKHIRMKRRIAKNKLNLDKILDNSHDVAVMHQVLWTLMAILKGGESRAIIRKHPFADKELNEELDFVFFYLKERGLV